PYTPLLSQNERAVATQVSSAPANAAVRAPPGRNAAPSGGLTRQIARSIKDWEVEDFVLLATVDGRIHARDRYTGGGIWELDLRKPMLETIYNHNESSGGDNDNKPFIWIVEPKEDGALYILTPGPFPVLQSLGMTVKQLTEDLAPYSSDDPPVVYTAEKKNFLFVVDARTGAVTKSFNTGGSVVIDTESCNSQATEYFSSRERECKGFFNIGQTEYTISIHNKINGDHICTIKYSEWTPNNRDRDLQTQYDETMDNQYIYSRYDGRAIAFDYNRKGRSQKRPVFSQQLSSPVVRVFDVARPFDDEDPEPALVLLPQPPGPHTLEDKERNVWLNTTEAGSWYALSEANYPAVTDSAPPALCYSPEWTDNELLDVDTRHLPDRMGLVGVHILNYQPEARTTRPGIDAPTSGEESGTVDEPTHNVIVPRPPIITREPEPELQPEILEPPARKPYSMYAFVSMIMFILLYGGYMGVAQPTKLDYLRTTLVSRLTQQRKGSNRSDPQVVSTETDPVVVLPEKEQVSVATDTEVPHTAPGVEAHTEKKVRFNIEDDEDDEMLALSRTTTAEQSSPIIEQAEAVEAVPKLSNAAEQSSTSPDETQQLQDGSPATPVKKKKTHRGKRGGQKKPRRRDTEDEVDKIVNAAKELDQAPSLHPDEITVNGDDVQDVSNIKKIGKLTIDFDRLLGNGSGGTFVFEGKWNEREVAVKRMLPQYFGLAEQEVKLLQESDLHPNVIRYFDDEKDENFLYIAVELCQSSLFDLYRDGRPGIDELNENQQRLVNEINADVPRALYQLAMGVNHLHSLRIIHRDIKPQNILIAYPQRNQKYGARLVISDFGLCKTLPDNVSTLVGTTGNAGTVGWKAPELILQPKDMDRGSSTGHSRDSSSSTDPVAQGVKRAVDIFSLGCVFFYVLTNGSHPFDDDEGWMQIREYNIKKNKANFTQLRLGDDSEEPIHLISWMLANRPEDRPTALQVLSHPFFWSAEKRLNFLCDCSDHWEREPRDPPSEHLAMLEEYSFEVLDKKRNFLDKLDRGFVNSLGKQRKYTGDRMLDLLRALRNKKNHYEDMDETVKAKVGPLPHGYLRYWTTKFPKLLMSCYDCVWECGLQGEPRFRPYFE
ncbi:kinase-like protein, partial [Aaosphaeria arxii CBS 175.79]